MVDFSVNTGQDGAAAGWRSRTSDRTWKTMSDAPFEIAEFEQLLRKPNSDPTGLASFFNSGEVWVARVPARLDVMGGIADYSGSNVCEAVLGRGMLMALQARTDRTLRIRSAQVGARS